MIIQALGLMEVYSVAVGIIFVHRTNPDWDAARCQCDDNYDMSGNLGEWTHDTYTGSLGKGATTDPVRESDSYRVIRGGNLHHYPNNIRLARRSYNLPTARYFYIGFRVGRTAP